MATKTDPKRKAPARKTSRSASEQTTLAFKAGLEGKPDKTIDVVAYAFDRGGRLLAFQPVKDGVARLALDPAKARSARIFFAPQRPESRPEDSATLETMERLHAYEASWTFDPKKTVYELLPIPEYLWTWWPWCFCRVRGRVVKPVSVGGDLVDLPVCNARVHICEVDPIWWIIPRLPDPIVFRLRDELLKEIEFPRPIPLPDPPPFVFDPGFVDPSPENIARMNRALVESNSLPEPTAFRLLSKGEQVMLNPQPLPPGGGESRLAMLSLETRVALNSPSIPLVRQALLDNVNLIRPYLCWWPWFWPWLCRCDEIAVLDADTSGRFDTSIWYSCLGDQPDLYFWVESVIGGSWTTVYHPNPVCCNTYWDYACGSEVTLRVTDPRVVPCGDPGVDLAGLQVAVISIGNGVSTHQIPVDSTASLPLSGSASEGLVNGTSPFGGRLEPHVNLSRSALFARGITHYRWSYRQLTEGAGGTPASDGWHTMPRQVIRHYQVYNPITSTLSYPPEPMGPDPLYPGWDLDKIQPIDAPTGFPEDWTPNVDAREDSASAFFESYLTRGGDAGLGAGKYELKFELFHFPAGVPTPVDFDAPPGPPGAHIALKVPNVDAPFGPGTVTFVDADDNHRFKNGANTVAFRVVLHVDNNVCQAAINEVSVDVPSNSAGPCGFISYADKHASQAHLSFIASHPHNFASLDFNVYKGSTGAVADAHDEGQVGQGGTDAYGYLNNASTGLYQRDVTVDLLLDANGVVCDKAAFGETLHVEAWATDGWGSLDYLDANGMPMAFALEPVVP
jgi:hypothetical protein